MSKRWRWLRTAILALLLIGCAGADVHASGDDGAIFSLTPTTYDPTIPATRGYFVLDGRPEEVITREVRVTNASRATGMVRLYPVDGATGSTSGAVYLAEGDPRVDAGAWIALDTAPLTLAAGESRVIPFTVNVPAAPRPGNHLGGIVAENVALQDITSGDAVQINIRHRNIIAVQVNLPGPVVEKVSVAGVTLGSEPGNQSLVFGLRNEGTTMVKPAGALEVRDAAGIQLQNIPLTLDTVLPQSAIDYPVYLQNPTLGVGDYAVTLTLAYGSNQQTRFTGHVSITPASVAQAAQGGQALPASGQANRTGPANATNGLVSNPSPPVSQPAIASTERGSKATSFAPWIILGAAGGMLFTLVPLGALIFFRRRT